MIVGLWFKKLIIHNYGNEDLPIDHHFDYPLPKYIFREQKKHSLTVVRVRLNWWADGHRGR